MHELGIVFHIADMVLDICKENNIKKVKKVTVEIGEVSLVIPYYLIDCWNWNAKRHEVLKGCELKVEEIKAITYCESCKKEYETVKYGKVCPYCKSINTYLLKGNETILKDIEVYDTKEST